jgi:hypothetical protein
MLMTHVDLIEKLLQYVSPAMKMCRKARLTVCVSRYDPAERRIKTQ